MKLIKPKFWSTKKSILTWLFFPLSYLVLIYIFLKKKIIKPIKFQIPIICIGNIYLGGTGKTPTAIFLANELLRLGKKPTILRKFYKSHIDEYDLIKSNFKSLILNKNRTTGIHEAIKRKYDMVILDDGFQDYKIKKDLSILCFNSDYLIGNGLTIPAGPCRENLNALLEVQIVLINGERNVEFENKILKINNKLKIFYSNFKALNCKQFENKNLLAIAGIGSPDSFFKLIEKNNLKIKRKLIFPDHYVFSKDEIQKIINEAKKDKLHIIMTEKDFFKIKNFQFKAIGYLKVSLEIDNKEEFLNLIKK